MYYINRWLFSTNAKDIGVLYLIYGFLSGLVGTALSVIIRMELSGGGAVYLAGNGDLYNSIITAHGLIMIFFMLMPALIGGFSNFILPIAIGSVDMSFPRLNNLSFMLLPGSLILIVTSFFTGTGAAVGWTVYPLLSSTPYSPGVSTDLAILSLHVAGISSLLGAINFMTTILNMRSPGLTMDKIPLFAWAVFLTAILLLLSLPVLAGGCALNK